MKILLISSKVTWGIEQNILNLIMLGHVMGFYPIKIPKIKIFKNEKSCLRYHHFTHVYQKSESYDVPFLRYGMRQTKFYVIMNCVLLFYPLKDPENQKFEEMKKKTSGHITILHTCTKNYCQMMYGSWDIMRNGQTDRQTVGRTDGRTERWMEKVIYRGECLT